MKTSALRILALVSISMLVLALWEPWLTGSEPQLGRIFDVTTVSEISHITIGYKSEVYEVQRDASMRWSTQGTRPARARPEEVRKLVGALSLLHPVRESKLAAHHGLAKSTFWIRFQAGEHMAGELRIGALATDERHRWIQLDDGGALLVESHLIDEVLAAAQNLESKRLLAERPTNLDALKIAGSDSWLQVQESLLSWTEKGQVAVDAARYAEFRDRLWALEFTGPFAGASSCDDTGPALSYTRNGALTQIFECGACSTEGVALRVEGPTASSKGCVPKQTWQSVVHTVEQPLELASLLLLPTRRALDSFTIQCRGEAVVVDSAQADERRLQQWWQALDQGAVAVESGVPGKASCRIESESWRLHIGKRGEHWYAWRPEGTLLYRLSAEASLQILNTKASRFRTLQLISEEPIFATRIQVKEGRASHVLKRAEQLGVWSSSQAATSNVQATSLATSLLTEVAQLRATEFVDEVVSRGEASRQLNVEFDMPATRQAARYQLAIWGKAGDGECLVQVNSQPLARLSLQSCESLLIH